MVSTPSARHQWHGTDRSSRMPLDAAYRSCTRDARVHYENFPVASRLIPRGMRPHVAAVYAFSRAADDFADEGDRPPEERHALLDAWQRRLHEAVHAKPAAAKLMPGEPPNSVEIFTALAATIDAKALPVELFDDLLSAFHQDVDVRRYGTWSELLDYCRRSANPVGRLVLRIAGYRDATLDGWSDDICTALQLTNFWQDVKPDFDRGRIYVPLDDLRTHGAGESELASGAFGPPWRTVLSRMVSRTRGLFEAGRPLCDRVGGRLGLELRATWLGGIRILDRLESSGFDAIRRRPTLGAGDVPWFAWRLATWRSDRGLG